MEILSLKQIASLLGISRRTVYRYMEAGMPYRQIVPKGKLFFDVNKVMKWMEEQTKANRF